MVTKRLPPHRLIALYLQANEKFSVHTHKVSVLKPSIWHERSMRPFRIVGRSVSNVASELDYCECKPTSDRWKHCVKKSLKRENRLNEVQHWWITHWAAFCVRRASIESRQQRSLIATASGQQFNCLSAPVILDQYLTSLWGSGSLTIFFRFLRALVWYESYHELSVVERNMEKRSSLYASESRRAVHSQWAQYCPSYLTFALFFPP